VNYFFGLILLAEFQVINIISLENRRINPKKTKCGPKVNTNVTNTKDREKKIEIPHKKERKKNASWIIYSTNVL
jgi:hypothetical protein